MRNYGQLDLSKEIQGNSKPSVEVAIGNYPAKILRVADNYEKEYLTLWFDFQDQRFAKASENDFEKWDSKGKYIVWYNQQAREKKQFDAFITAITNSNEGFRWEWNEQALVGKKMVVVYGEEEWYNDKNELLVAIKPRMIRSIQAYQKGEIKPLPIRKAKPKETPNSFNVNPNGFGKPAYQNYNSYSAPTSSDEMPQYYDVNVSDDDLPF